VLKHISNRGIITSDPSKETRREGGPAMKILTCSLLLLLLTTTVDAQQDGGQVVVYFDEAGTVRYKDSPGAGVIEEVWIYGENFGCTFVSGVQYSVDYGPNLQWITDLGLPPAYIGYSPVEKGGIAMGFGLLPRPGSKFLIHSALVMWTADCTVDNVDGPVVLPHPTWGPVMYTCYPSGVYYADGARSQTCQYIGLDIKPGSCPNPFNAHLWDWAMGANAVKGGVLPVAILGSETVDVSAIDPSSVKLEGVAPLPIGQGLADVGTLDGDIDCICNAEDADGWMDLTLKFRAQDIAAAIPAGNVGDVIPLTLTGCYDDGMPFSATDCITVVGNARTKAQPSNAVLGSPNPNPFNPVTWISYAIPEAQHVRLTVYDVTGRLVEELVNEVKAPGKYVVEWDAGNMPSGIYFYRLEAGNFAETRKAILLK
jgi:hypothetical protein